MLYRSRYVFRKQADRTANMPTLKSWRPGATELPPVRIIKMGAGGIVWGSDGCRFKPSGRSVSWCFLLPILGGQRATS